MKRAIVVMFVLIAMVAAYAMPVSAKKDCEETETGNGDIHGNGCPGNNNCPPGHVHGEVDCNGGGGQETQPPATITPDTNTVTPQPTSTQTVQPSETPTGSTVTPVGTATQTPPVEGTPTATVTDDNGNPVTVTPTPIGTDTSGNPVYSTPTSDGGSNTGNGDDNSNVDVTPTSAPTRPAGDDRKAECYSEIIVGHDTESFYNDVSRLDDSGVILNMTRELGAGRDEDVNVKDCSSNVHIRNGYAQVTANDGSISNQITFEDETFETVDIASNGNGLVAVLTTDGHIHVMDAYLETGKASFHWEHQTNATAIAMSPSGELAYIEDDQLHFASANGQIILETTYRAMTINFNEDGSILTATINDRFSFEIVTATGEFNSLDPRTARHIETDPTGLTDLALITTDETVQFGTFTGDHLMVNGIVIGHELGQTDWWTTERPEPVNVIGQVANWATRIK